VVPKVNTVVEFQCVVMPFAGGYNVSIAPHNLYYQSRSCQAS
jgi:hypothetical protein